LISDARRDGYPQNQRLTRHDRESYATNPSATVQRFEVAITLASPPKRIVNGHSVAAEPQSGGGGLENAVFPPAGLATDDTPAT